MGKLLICTVLLMLMSGATTMAVEVAPMLLKNQSGMVWVNNKLLANGVETEVDPGPVRISGVLHEQIGDRTYVKSCFKNIPLIPGNILYLVYLQDIKNDRISCRMIIDHVIPDSPRAKQLKSQLRSGK